MTCEAVPTCPQDYTPVNGHCEKIVPVEKVCPSGSTPTASGGCEQTVPVAKVCPEGSTPTASGGCEKIITQEPTICPSGTKLNAGTCESRPGCTTRTTSSGTAVGSIQRNPNCIRT